MQYDKFLQTQSPFDSFERLELHKYQKVAYLEKLPGLYEDSSSEVWLIEYLDMDDCLKEAVVKVYKKTNDTSPFWKAMQILFDLDLCSSYQQARISYPLLSQITTLKIPKVYDCLLGEDVCAMVLENIKGQSYSANPHCTSSVRQLARFLAEMHSYSVEKIGLIAEQKKENGRYGSNVVGDSMSATWQAYLTQAILTLSRDLDVSEQVLAEVLTGIKEVSISKVVPIMLDLRWDQFAQDNNRLMGIYDLDAFVFAPIELDFIILEYILTAEELVVFKEQYQLELIKCGALVEIPCLKNVRAVYRFLLFLMNVLGEADIEKWLAQPHFFNIEKMPD